MTLLDESQLRMIAEVRNVYEEVAPVLKKMEEDYEYAVYKAKKPIRDRLEEALEAGVPMNRLTAEATDFTYAQKFKKWLEANANLAARLDGGDVVLQTAEVLDKGIEAVSAVTRNQRTGEFNVAHKGESYSVTAMGSDAEAWSTREDGIPQAVYDLITEKYPTFVVLEEDD